MNEELKMSYESMGSSSYMTVTCPPGVKLVNYELEMVLSNEIENFLTVSRQMLDGETVIYYNITSRISLRQVLDKRKLNRKELFHLMEGAILAVRDAAAYRLPSAGIVLEPEYIYVNPASCAPAFVFMPLQGPAGPGIRELISDLVLHDKIEMSNDNFIQVLLMELNRQPFSYEELEKSLKPYKVQKYGMQVQDQNSMFQPPVNLQPVMPQPVNPQQVMPQPVMPQPVMPQSVNLQPANPQPVDNQTGKGEWSAGERPFSGKVEGKPGVPPFQKGQNTGKIKKTEKKKALCGDGEENGNDNRKDGFDPEKAKKKFMLPQALVMVVVAASISFGLFTDESGGIVLNNILAFVIVLALAEVILYREIYVNSKVPGKGKREKTTGVKKTTQPQKPTRPEMPLRREPKRPELPRPEPPRLVNSQPVSQVQFNPQPIPRETLPPFAPTPAYGQQPMPQYPQYGSTEDTNIQSETELWEGEAEGGMSAYLEYFENGKLSRIPLDSIGGVVIGRLKQQVDFAVNSPRVGKVHARFFGQNGQYYVVDINSKNGTYINGSIERIESNLQYSLHDKDRIMLADSEFTIRCSEG